MAFKFEEEVEDPIAEALGKIPGIGGFLKNVQKQTSPKGYLGPGIFAQTVGRLTGENPQAIYDAGVNRLSNYADVFGSLVTGGASIPARMAGAALPPMVLHALSGQGLSSPGTGLIKGGIAAATQGAVEGATGLARQFLPRIGRRALADKAEQGWLAKMAKHADDAALLEGGEAQQAKIEKEAYELYKKGVEEANTKALKQAKLAYKREAIRLKQEQATAQAVQDSVYAADKGSFTENVARTIMDDAKANIPWWKDLPSNVKGIMSTVLGKGQELLSKHYDEAMKAALATAKGKSLVLDPVDARKLMIPQAAEDVIVAKTAANPLGIITKSRVDAADVIEAITKPGNRDWQMYKRIVEELDKQDLGIDPAAREMYKYGQGVIKAIDSSGGIVQQSGWPTLDTEKLLDGFLKVKGINILKNRGMGTIDDAVIPRAAMGTPQPPPKVQRAVQEPFVAPEPKSVIPPPERTLLTIPPEPPYPDIVTQDIPGSRIGRAGALASILGGAGFYGGGWGGAREMAALGGAIGALSPNEWVLKAPMSESIDTVLNAISQGAGAAARQPVSTFLSPKRTPASNIDEAARLKALDEEGLEMDDELVSDE